MNIIKHITLAATLVLVAATAAPVAQAQAPQSGVADKTIVYFTRHAEDVPELDESDPSFSIIFNDCNEAGTCCVEVLNPLGQVRASALADWFEAQGITQTLTHVVATHKIRTRQTVAKIALLAGLGGDLDGDGAPDGADIDQDSGDGVMNVPSTPAECDFGWESSSSVLQPQIDYISTLPLRSRAVVCTHGPVLYRLMEAFGIDTSDPVKFPRNASGRVNGFNNLWKVELIPVEVDGTLIYQGRLLEHLLLDIDVGVSLVQRDYGVKPGLGSRSDEE